MRRVLESTGVRLEPEVRLSARTPVGLTGGFEEWERASNYGICHRYRLVRRGEIPAVDALEDIGFYCVDNMPPKLLSKFAELCLKPRIVSLGWRLSSTAAADRSFRICSKAWTP